MYYTIYSLIACSKIFEKLFKKLIGLNFERYLFDLPMSRGQQRHNGSAARFMSLGGTEYSLWPFSI